MIRTFQLLLISTILIVTHLTFGQIENTLLLKDYRPVSIYHVPVSHITKSSAPIWDMHSHPYAENQEQLKQWIETQQSHGIAKTVILSYATGGKFDSLVDVYGKYKQFDIWCGFDYSGYDQPGWSEKAIAELERCHNKGAKGIGELGDKGKGLIYSYPTPAIGMHIDDAKMAPVLKRCGELGMPVSIHVTEPYWMYQPIDSSNDGLINAAKWKVDSTQTGVIGHAALIKTLENAVKNNPGTTFIACHFANTSNDLSILAGLFDKYPNLYADIAARYAETAPIPRYMKKFYQKYQDRLLYGTDMGMDAEMYEVTFRILESEDEHFYAIDQFDYHWPLYGFGLPAEILRKVYSLNAKKIYK